MIDAVPQDFIRQYATPAPVTTSAQIPRIRLSAITETAMSLGAQGGLSWRYSEINKKLSARAPKMDAIYNFGSLMLEGGVLPPVLLEGRDSSSTNASADMIRVADANYYIASQAKFMIAAPNWRDYLSGHYEMPERPHESLLPKNDDEKKAWDEALHKGWTVGRNQADEIFEENMSRLNRDMNGMIRYHVLLKQNMVSRPFVAQSDLGTTSGKKFMNVNDRVLRITDMPSFNANTAQWSASAARQGK